MILRELLISTTRSWQLDLDPQQIEQCERYADALVRWNARTNLTAITDPREITIRHFLDSLALARVWLNEPPESLADIGTGAGFPGLVLKILWPSVRVLLVESVGKKTEFLRHLVDTLRLEQVEIRTSRAEELGQDQYYREHYDAVTARAVASLNVLAEYCLPLCKVGGVFVAPKAADGPKEAKAARNAIELLGGQIERSYDVQLPDVELRSIIVVRKTGATPPRFPRRAGVPAKRPL